MMDWLVITVLLAVGLLVGLRIRAAADATGLWGAAHVATGVVLVFAVFVMGLSTAFLYEDAHPRPQQCQNTDEGSGR
jgi:L-alanine-DL-glutamate epimerase-like enolase superfamily enzyme